MGDEELKKKKIRGGHKGYVTITLEKVQALLDDFELSVANQVKTYRIALTEKLNILSALDEEILTLITEEYIEDDIRETGIFRESIHEMIVRIDETLNAVEAHVRALQALGIHCESYGKLLVPLLMKKLPPNMRLIISRAIDQPAWDLDVLLKAFDSEIEARERCEPIGTNPSDSFTPKRPFSSQANKDDFNGGKDSVPEAFQLYTKAKSRMKEGGFNLRKWISNSEKLMQWINQEEGVPIKEASMSASLIKRVLPTEI
ncbi:hypothetical protein P5673_016575 [Acropora cervicornis]|uniref:Uncharacterized protein n=1 Tax=Acropora cervicornis TaxID=6130 RepID=A0AAD9QGM3_ACRCE|nr:hypothetical protein P5673_016575 [Acropora cervicornis]